MAKKLRKVIRSVPATTSNLTTGIVNFIIDCGHWAGRINNGAIFDPKIQTFRRKRKDDPKLTDVMACVRGNFFAIEIKNEHTKDRMREGQDDFRQLVEDAGGVYILARELEQFKIDFLFYKDTCWASPRISWENYLKTFRKINLPHESITTLSTEGGSGRLQQLESGEQKRDVSTGDRRG